MKQLFYTLSFVFLCHVGFTQTESFGKIDFGFQGLAIGYEAGLNDNLALNTSAGIGGGYSSKDFPTGREVGYSFELGDPTLHALAELKYFTNQEKREERGKRTSLNSSNYLAYQIKYAASNESQADNNESLLNEIHWGFQRRLGEESNFLFNMHLGLGYLYDFEFKDGQLVPTVGGKFAFKIF